MGNAARGHKLAAGRRRVYRSADARVGLGSRGRSVSQVSSHQMAGAGGRFRPASAPKFWPFPLRGSCTAFGQSAVDSHLRCISPSHCRSRSGRLGRHLDHLQPGNVRSVWRFAPLAQTIRRAAILLAALPQARSSRAQSTWQSGAALTLDARGELGTGTVSGIELGAVGAGVEWRLAPTLRLRTTGLVLGGTGAADTGRSAKGGVGGELGARMMPFPSWPVRPYLRMSAGFLLFLRGPFLPGGEFYDFIIGIGAGLELPIGPRFSVVGDLHE